MSEDFDPPNSDNPANSDRPSESGPEKPSHLRLVVSNPPANTNTPQESTEQPSLPGIKIYTTTRKWGGVYRLLMQDPFHHLEREYYLELTCWGKRKVAVCHLPVFREEDNLFMEWDGALCAVITVRFQLEMLRQFFLFCRTHKALHLVLYIDGGSTKAFGLYRSFTSTMDDMQMVMPVNLETLDLTQWDLRKASLRKK